MQRHSYAEFGFRSGKPSVMVDTTYAYNRASSTATKGQPVEIANGRRKNVPSCKAVRDEHLEFNERSGAH